MVIPINRSFLSPASPGSPLDMKFQSKRYHDKYGGIGLGIVAALEFSSDRYPVCNFGSGSNRSDPVHCAKRFLQLDLFEEYTCVTSRVYGMTKVYYNDNEFETCPNHHDPRFYKPKVIPEELPEKKDTRFLNSCCLCKKKLYGKDIYMYKGDKGFCSKVCRSVKIMEDNFKGKRELRNVEVFKSPYTGGTISSTGIFVI